MQQKMQRQPAATPIPSAVTPDEARRLAESMIEVMTTLLGLIERETELVRAGKIREAMAFEPKKTELSRRYVQVLTLLKASHKYLQQSAPELLTALLLVIREKGYGHWIWIISLRFSCRLYCLRLVT